MQKLSFKISFRERITEDSYSFDLLARNEDEHFPHVVGTIVVNVKTGNSIAYANVEPELSYDEYQSIASSAIDSAQKLKRIIDGK